MIPTVMTPFVAARRFGARSGAVVVAVLVALTAAVAVPLASARPATASASENFDEYAADPDLAQDHADVFRLYWAFFDRKPDADGARYWVDEYDECVSLLDITWSFGNSAEFRNTYGSLSDRDYVTLVYENVLDRRPDAKGYAYWTGLLSSGELSREELMLYFSLGPEFRRKRPLPSDGRPYEGCTPPSPVTTQTSTTQTSTTQTATSQTSTTQTSTTQLSTVHFANCAEAWAAGAAPLRRGDPGYRSGLDRDNDGIACENPPS